jgi:DNA-binding YbaB/EbfC family protein
MFGGIGDMIGLMKQARAMKEQMEQFQAQAASLTFEADAGAGAVTATVNGRGELMAVKINPETVNPSDVEMLEDLIRAAVNAANRKAQETMKAEVAKITAGLNLPGLDALTNS